MKVGVYVTVVHKGKCLRAMTYMRGEEWFEFGRLFWGGPGEDSGKLRASEEDIRWTRGWLWKWWPPHKRRMRALEVADALAGPREEEKPPHVPPTKAAQMIANFNRDVAKMMNDANKLVADANKVVHGATTRTTTWRVRVTKRR
ncbi:MAG TPA: hypothetical protein VGY48_15995 [Vicinamibacterales bacterium]|jgi:hypothetical protein|nr:hypothetical protein [Vicinamibacterales bacterium]